MTVTDGEVNLYLSALAVDGGVDQPKLSAIQIQSFTTTAKGNVTNEPNAVVGTELIDPFDIVLFPNPGATQVTISTRSLEQELSEIRIFDATGQLVRSYDPSQYRDGYSEYTLPVSSLQAGVYHLGILTTDGRTYLKQLIIRK